MSNGSVGLTGHVGVAVFIETGAPPELVWILWSVKTKKMRYISKFYILGKAKLIGHKKLPFHFIDKKIF